MSRDAMHDNIQLDEQQLLLLLIQEAKQYVPKSRKYRKLFNQIASIIQTSEKLYQKPGSLKGKPPAEANDIYSEAIQRTLIYLNKNLCKYDPSRSQVMTWFNNALKWRIRDVIRERQSQYPPNRIYPIQSADGKTIDPLLNSPAQELSPQSRVEAQNLQEWLRWKIEQQKEELEGVYLRTATHINAYKVLIHLIPPWNKMENFLPSIKELALEFKIDKRRLRKFYMRRCLPYLSQYVREYGWDIHKVKCQRDQTPVLSFVWFSMSQNEVSEEVHF